MMQAIAAVGECMIELSGQDGDHWRMGYAGDTFNTLWTLRALLPDHRTDFVSAFGDDPFSERQVAFLEEHGIGIADSPSIAGARPGLYAITLDGAERSFTYWRNDAAARRLADDPARLAKSLSGRSLIYFSGITLAILPETARLALLDAIGAERGRGAHVAFDPNYRPRLWPDATAARNAIGDALGVVDIVLPTFPDEASLFGDASSSATAARLQRAGITEIVVKNGDREALVAHGGRVVSLQATRIAAPLDTTGAGDSFNGAYLSARLVGIEPAQAVERAHRVAGAVVEVRGALAPFHLLTAAFDRPRG